MAVVIKNCQCFSQNFNAALAKRLIGPL